MIERDISWLHFNERVLQEAADHSLPLYERIKFLAIYSSNLDEFFRVRVSSMRRFKELKKETRKALLDIKPKRILKQVRAIVQEQQEEFGRIFRSEIVPGLADNDIYMVHADQFTEAHKAFAKSYFDSDVRAHADVHRVGGDSESFLVNQGLYFAVSKEDEIYEVNIPSENLDRFVVLPGEEGRHYITFLDEIVRLGMSELIGGEADEIIAIKMSRDAELYIGDEYSGNLLEKLKQSLDQRDSGAPTRFLYDSTIGPEFLERLKELYGLTKYDLVPGARYHNFHDFFGFPDPVGNPEFFYEPQPPLDHPELRNVPSIFDEVVHKDFILHYPYQKIDYLLNFLDELAGHPNVTSISMTLYRAANKSKIADALIQAVKNEKNVTVFIEAKARFNEASNLNYGDELRKAGATVLYSYPGIKVHSKMLHVSFDEIGGKNQMAYLSTGNFNEKTARIYCDHGFLTSDPKICEDVRQVFLVLSGKIILPNSKLLLVSPFTMKQQFKNLVRKEIALAQQGRPAYLILKMNSLEDPEMIELLYQAHGAGVHIRLIIRGISCISVGHTGLSEKIEARSIVDRYLEHARVYIFGNEGNELMYLASADWMSRNLDRRIEIAWPIQDPQIKSELRRIVDLQLTDSYKARSLHEDRLNHMDKTDPDSAAQNATYKWLKSLLA